MEPEEQRPPEEEARPPELLHLHPAFRAVLLLFGGFLLVLGLGSLLGSRLEYANWVHQEVVAPLAIVIGGIMLFAGVRGRVWS
jgi:hypothetical protein